MDKVDNAPATGWVRICASHDVVERARGVRFPLRARFGWSGDVKLTGFVVRFQGSVYAYLNQCAHVASELDWQPGEFFDHSGLYLMCATHGAVYEPETGLCTEGPCRGARLRAIQIVEQDGSVFWQPDDVLCASENET